MTVVYFSSVFNHHSLPICDALNSLPGVACYFVATREEETQRKELGYHSYSRNYVTNMLESEESRQKAYQLAMDADVMIAGVFPYEFLKERLKRGKLTFLCQERMFKFNASWLMRARAWLFNLRKYSMFARSPLYLLSIGKGAARDYDSIGLYRGKSFQWAYFPPFMEYNLQKLMAGKESSTVKILFVGRLIGWKHPEYALRATKKLLEKGYPVELSYVGIGEMEEGLREQAVPMSERVIFLGAMSPEDVRQEMEKANVLVFTSNKAEGWGAVLNEGMNAGCAVVCSSFPGSVNTLIKDGYNGSVYEGEDYEQFYQKLEQLVADKEMVRRLGEAAYKTIAEYYNAQSAAQRLYQQARALLDKAPLCDFTEGPMKLFTKDEIRGGK